MKTAQRITIPYERKPGTIHSFFALKFHDGEEDRAKVEAIETALNQAGVEITLMARDVEKWGKAEIPKGKTLMRDYAFPAMQQCDCNIIEFSEKGVGLGMNGGFCYAIDKPIYVIAKTGSDISTTMANIATKVVFYDKPEDLTEPFTEIARNFPRVILASGSKYRKAALEAAGIPFETIVSNADETPDQSKNLRDQLADIAMRKAKAVFERTKNRGRRLIVAADHNLMFDNKLYGKPKDVTEARKILHALRGSRDIYSYVGNAVLLAEKDKILQSVNLTDSAKLAMDNISDTEIEDFLSSGTWHQVCGGANVGNALFVHVVAGRTSTAHGLTLEYTKDLLRSL